MMKRYMKSLLGIVLALGMVVSMTGCGESPEKAVKKYIDANDALSQDLEKYYFEKNENGVGNDEIWQSVSVTNEGTTVKFIYTYKKDMVTDVEKLKNAIEENFKAGKIGDEAERQNDKMIENIFRRMQEECKYIEKIEFVYMVEGNPEAIVTKAYPEGKNKAKKAADEKSGESK